MLDPNPLRPQRRRPPGRRIVRKYRQLGDKAQSLAITLWEQQNKVSAWSTTSITQTDRVVLTPDRSALILRSEALTEESINTGTDAGDDVALALLNYVEQPLILRDDETVYVERDYVVTYE